MNDIELEDMYICSRKPSLIDCYSTHYINVLVGGNVSDLKKITTFRIFCSSAMGDIGLENLHLTSRKSKFYESLFNTSIFWVLYRSPYKSDKFDEIHNFTDFLLISYGGYKT